MYRLWVTYTDDEIYDNATYVAGRDYFDNDSEFYNDKQVIKLANEFTARGDVADVFVEDMETGRFINIRDFEKGTR